MITLKSEGPVGILVDVMTSDMPEHDRTTEPALRAVQAVYDTAVKEAKESSKNPELTPLGQREATKRAISKAREALKSHEDTAERLEAKVKATRSKALELPSGVQRDPVVEREIRDRLIASTKDPLMVGMDYLRAIERGDHCFVNAVENAPQAFPLIDADPRRRGEEAKLAMSPMKAQVEAQEVEHARYRQIVDTTRTELRRLAERYDIHR